MTRHNCGAHFNRPAIALPKIERTKRDEELARNLAAEIAQIALTANEEEAESAHQCSLAARARRKFSAMSKRDRAMAMRFARKVGAGAEGRGGHDVDKRLMALMRRMARGHMDKFRRGFSKAILEVADQGRAQPFALSKTKVAMRPAGEIIVKPHRYLQTNDRPKLTFHWESDEPEAEKVYWELRGSATTQGDGPLLDRGIAENMFDDGRVGGTFTLSMRNYFQPVTPNPAQRFTIRVLPLVGLEKKSFAIQRHYAPQIADLVLVGEPEPPAGVGAWSPKAVIDYGTEFVQPGTRFDAPVTYYTHVRSKVNWFKVDVDQPGPGGEEYHLRAFFTDFSPLGAEQMGKWGTYLPISEGDGTRHNLGWETRDVNLRTPATNTWPRFQFMVLSVLEEDSGEGLDAWKEAMSELAEETLRGELEEEINDYLQKMKAELEEATEDLGSDVKEATQEYIAEIIGAAATAAAGAILAYAVAMITSFAEAGALDDFYGVETIMLTLKTNEADQIEDGSGLVLGTSRVLSSGSISGGQRDGDRFETDEFEMQLIVPIGPDAAGLGGIVRFGVQWEFTGRQTRML